MTDYIQPSHCVSNSLHQTARAITKVYSEEMRPSGILRSQFSILGYLSYFGVIQLTELADSLYMDRTTLSRNLKPLEKRGLVRVTKSSTDARARDVSLTAEGKAQFREATKYWRKAQKRIITTFGEKNWSALESTLLSLRNQVS
ncbi:MAG: DNA-binding MarR family transcriptional regulator [Candidatus Azotimanducaceae bacterium]|jgi:DNA-binding MarR family transcriptional regulator